MNVIRNCNSVVHMLVGVPGSGKSSFVDNFPLFKENPFVLASSDVILERVAENKGSTYNDVFKEHIKYATKEVENDLIHSVAFGFDVVIDRTNCNIEKSLNRWKNLLRSRGCRIPKFYVWILDVPVETALERNANRDDGRIIDESIIRSMHENLQKSMESLVETKKKNPEDEFFIKCF